MIIYIYLFMFTVFIWGVFYLLQSIVFDNPEPFDLNEIIGIIMLSILPMYVKGLAFPLLMNSD